jgi:hypothetical protein
MSDESTNLIPNQRADPILAEPSGNAANGQANKGDNDSACFLSEPAETAEPVDGEVLQSFSFEVFWHGSVEPRGHLGFALAEWRKLTVDQQRLACERPARDAWAGVWLRDRGFDLEPGIDKPRGAASAITAAIEAGDDVDEVWRKHLRREIGPHLFSAWFATAHPVSIKHGTVTIAVANQFNKSWIESHFEQQLLNSWREQDTTITKVDLVVATVG